MKIYFHSSYNETCNNYFVDYNNMHSSSEYFCDLRKHIKINQNIWLDSLSSWHDQLCLNLSKITKMWWLCDGSRRYTWTPPIYKPFIFAVALLDYCKINEINEISLFDCPQEVYNYLKELSPNDQIILLKSKNEYFYEHETKALKLMLKQLLKIFLLATFNFFRSFSINYKKEYLIYSQILSNNKSDVDHFFGEIFHKSSSTKILWFYQGLSILKFFTNKFILKINKDNTIFSIRYLNFKDCLFFIYNFFKFFFLYNKFKKKLPILKIDGYKSKILPLCYFNTLIKNKFPLEEFIIYRSLQNIIKNNPSIKKIIYPYEEKSLERSILLVCEMYKNITTYGYAHSVHWNLHYYYKIKNNLHGLKPDYVLVTGILEKKWLIEYANNNINKIIVLGSNRYTSKIFEPPNYFKKKIDLKILLTVGQPYDLIILSSYLQKINNIFDGTELLIRKYPFSWNEEQEKGLSIIKKYVKKIKINNTDSLNKQIKWSNAIIYSTSSCGIIGMLNGRITINVALNDFFYWDPFEKDGSKNAILHCENPDNLNQTLKKIKSLNKYEYSEIVNKQKEYASKIYSPINNEILDKILS